ncbi:hypothetical protein BT63DRAFT_29057 [Microthyrium microscopicum]|uniref:Uncharacterized protein n=1 Tax=Microthyrium microscopicum TaxID=703497 RepID=A0A6A6UUM4_9PEZI|nr:hypothetical protein BT63DRAFT_29057 [Microthyrium microscopicum]
MLPQHVLVALATALVASALPLNINLGAYSPALVVGDGEISFGGTPERASEILQTLASGAQNGAVAPGSAPPAGTAGTAASMSPVPAAPAPAPAPAVGSPLVSPAPAAPAPATPAPAVAEVVTAPTNLAPPEYISQKIGGGFNPLKKFPNMVKRDETSAQSPGARRIKRDIDGFREALAYARDAIKNQPKIQLGTKEAGVGIVISPGANIPINSAANGARPAGAAAVEKRATPAEEVTEEPKLGMTLIAIGEI